MSILFFLLFFFCSTKISRCAQSCSTCLECAYTGCSKTTSGVERFGFACGSSQYCMYISGKFYGPYSGSDAPADKCTYTTATDTSWYDCPDKRTSCAAGEYFFDYYCFPCLANSFCVGGTAFFQTCSGACSKGQYQQNECTSSADRVCVNCPANYYCPTGSLALISCPPNTNSPSLSTELINCTANPGFYGLPGTVPTACASGTYMTGSGYTSVSSCLSCPSGKYSNQIAQTTCKTCNSAVPTSPATSCTCPAGMYHNLSDTNSECNNCPAGSFSTYHDLYHPLLYYTSTDRNAMPFIASPEELDFCGFGPSFRENHYLSRQGRVIYFNCNGFARLNYNGEIGWYTSTLCIGGWSCLKTTWPNNEMCIYCPRNYYNPVPGQTSCLLCPFNTTTTGLTFATSCLNCTSPTRCCQPGTYLKNASDLFCTPCWYGSYNANQDQTTCTACAPGMYTSSTGSIYAYNCISCSVGTYSSSVQQQVTSCMVCSTGTYASQLGATACTSCESGKYTSVAGSTSCTNCPLNYYQNAMQQSACNICPQSTYTTMLGADLCSFCLPGFACSGGNINACQNGTTYSLGNQSLCTNCSGCSKGEEISRKNSFDF